MSYIEKMVAHRHKYMHANKHTHTHIYIYTHIYIIWPTAPNIAKIVHFAAFCCDHIIGFLYLYSIYWYIFVSLALGQSSVFRNAGKVNLKDIAHLIRQYPAKIIFRMFQIQAKYLGMLLINHVLKLICHIVPPPPPPPHPPPPPPTTTTTHHHHHHHHHHAHTHTLPNHLPI